MEVAGTLLAAVTAALAFLTGANKSAGPAFEILTVTTDAFVRVTAKLAVDMTAVPVLLVVSNRNTGSTSGLLLDTDVFRVDETRVLDAVETATAVVLF